LSILVSIVDFTYWYFHPVIGFIFIAGFLLYWFKRKKIPSEKILKTAIFILLGILIIKVLFLSIAHWLIWSHDPLTIRMLPPITSITYFLFRIWRLCFMELTLNIGLALLAWLGVFFLNKKGNSRFFYEEEKWLIVLGILVNSWPASLIFVCLVLMFGLITHIIKTIFIKDKESRLSFLYFWLPIALLTLCINAIIIQYTPFKNLLI